MVKRAITKLNKSQCMNASGKSISLNIINQQQGFSVTIRKNWSLLQEFSKTITVIVFSLLFCCLYNINIIYIYIVAALVFIYSLISLIKEENLIMVKSLGYQVTTKYLIREKSIFIPFNRVQNLFINEVIYRGSIIYLLTIMTSFNGKQELYPLFSNMKPSLQCLELIYKLMKTS